MFHLEQYIALEVVSLPGGAHVSLTASQARTRRRRISKTAKAGEYQLIEPCEFKRGERFGYEGDLRLLAGDRVALPDQPEVPLNRRVKQVKNLMRRGATKPARRRRGRKK